MVVLAMAAGCMESPTPAPVNVEPAPVQAEAKVEAADATKAEPAEPAKAEAPPLSEEDQRLIAADPQDLSPEDRRKRAYALRRKIMQNPDSPTARTLKDLEEAARRGEIDPQVVKKKEYPTLSLPGTEPSGGKPPAGYRPPADEDAKAQ